MSRKYPSTYEAPILRLLKYAFFIWLTGILTGAVVTLIADRTNWWQQLGTVIINFHVAHPWFFLIYGGFGLVSIMYLRRKTNE